MFCRFCGTQLHDEAVFCGSCGKRVETTKKELTEKVTHSFREEFKKSVLPFAFSLLYLIWYVILRVLIIPAMSRLGADDLDVLVPLINYGVYIFSFCYGALAYTAEKRSFRISMVLLLPILLGLLIYIGHRVLSGTAFPYSVSFEDIFSTIIVPLIMVGAIRLIKLLMPKVKSQILMGGIATLIAILVISLVIIATNRELGNPFVNVEAIVRYALGICATNLLLHIVYREK